MLTMQAFKNAKTWLLEGGFIKLMDAESFSSPNTIAPIADAIQAHEISIDEFTSSVTPVREDEAGQAKAKHYVGHNPTGAIVIYAMLGIGLTAVASGILVFENGWIFTDTYTDAYKIIHHYTTWGWLFLVVGHVTGVIAESILHRDNLIFAMIAGCKRVCKIKPPPK